MRGEKNRCSQHSKGMTQPALQKALDIDNTMGRWERIAVRVCFPSMPLCKLCMLLNTFVNVCASTLFCVKNLLRPCFSHLKKRVWVGGTCTFLSICEVYRLHQKACTYMLVAFQIMARVPAFLCVPQYQIKNKTLNCRLMQLGLGTFCHK